MTPDLAFTEAAERASRTEPRAVERDAPAPEFAPVALGIECPHELGTRQPVCFGVPLPRGVLPALRALQIEQPGQPPVPTQTSALACWADGSIQWLLVDAVMGPMSAGLHNARLALARDADVSGPTSTRITQENGLWVIDTGAAQFNVSRQGRLGLQAVVAGRTLLDRTSSIVLTDNRGRRWQPRIEHTSIECSGPARSTILLRGRFGRLAWRFQARLSFYAGTGLVRLDATLHNPRRARHPGNLWDLGDAGSLALRGLELELVLAGSGATRKAWRAEPAQETRSSDQSFLELYQESSGGENWQSTAHLNRQGRVPLVMRGYRVQCGDDVQHGLRASPVVALASSAGSVTAAIPHFWQQFPKAIACADRTLRLGLFPAQFADGFEIQGGERKTHALWLDVGSSSCPDCQTLAWVHDPLRVEPGRACYAASGVLGHRLPARLDPDPRFLSVMDQAIDANEGLVARRERIDEYGWRHFGEIYADHEQEHYPGPGLAVSHYNNQYDIVQGAILQDLRTGDRRWSAIHEPLARHVIDIDIYHTTRDRAAYNGGLFWLTDHYRHAHTCTHRTYSRHNAGSNPRAYGGGPSSNHVFSTGLLLHYYRTGDPAARDAVIELADWIVAMDDGKRTILGLVDGGPTGLASLTGTLDYHGPGRGGGNSINTLLDGWLASGEESYLRYAETLIRRCIHPADDIAARELSNAEKRWSYTLFLSTLVRYLELKAAAGRVDETYAYARESLAAYARWMLENEVASFDRRDELEYPTEAWPCQDLRKANVLRLASAYVDEPWRDRLFKRGGELAERAWSDLFAFDPAHRASARALAILMIEGTVDAGLRAAPPRPMPRFSSPLKLDPPTAFVPQKTRVLSRLRTPAGWLALAAGLVGRPGR